MAEIIVLNNVFDTKDKNCYLCNEQKTIKEFLYEQNLDKKDYSLTVEIYDPETDTTYYEPLEDDESNMLVNINVNGLVKDLDYKIQPCDKIIIEILPASSSNNEDLVGGLIISGMFFAIAALAIFTGGAGLFGAAAITGEILANYGTILGFGLLAAGLGATTLAMTLSSDNTSSSELSSNSDDNSERNPSISGSQNQALGTNAFPLVIGDVIATPFVVGSFYTEYEKNSSFDKTWLGSNQKAYLLLAVGYAPLLIKDIKLDELKIAGNPKNVLNGILSLDYGSDEIGASWKNNNPRFEISQFGQNRTIYPYTVKQKKIESTLLYCYDKQYSDIATENTITWQGGTFPTGMRNIPIYFSESVPYKISVGIKFPAGLYETWADSDGNTMYRKIPMNLVVQWRPYYKLVDKNSNATDNGTSRYNKAEGYTIGRYGQWRDFDDNAIIPKVTYNAKDWKYHYKVYSRIDKLYTDGNGNVSTSYGYKKDDYFGYWEVYTNSENNYATDYSDKVNEDERVDDGSNFRWVPLLKYLSKEECKNLFVQAFLAKRKINPNATTVWVDGKCYSTVGHSWNTTGSAKRWANQFYEEYYYDQHFCWAREHPNIREVLKDTPYQVTNSRVEVQSNYGLSDGTDTNCNPNWIGSTVFCFGKYSGGVNFYKQNDFMPETISNADREKLFVKNINDAKDEMDFELTATLDQDTILDLINRNPKSIELGGVDDDATTVNEFSDNTECLLDSIQVRVVRLTPCYVAKNIDSQQHSYQDVVQWSYLKTYCLDKQKLLQDIDYVEKGKKFPKINCNADSYNVDTQATVITPDGKETLNVKEVMTKEGSSKWNAFPISNYYSTPLNKTDQENLVTIGVEITPDKLGYISNSINKINLSAKAIMPAFVSNKLKSNPNFIRYVKKENNLYFFCDRYDAQSDILGISDDSYSITNSSLKWELASSTGANSEIFDEIKSSALTEIGSKDEITYSYYLKNNSWDKVFFPKKIETKQIDELVTDNNGNVVYEDATTLVPMYEKVKYGNDWFNYIKNEMALNKKSYYDSNSNLIGTRWEATESFINTFCSQNAIVQALGFLTGKSLGKDAYAFNSYNTDKFLRLWRVKGGEYFYYNTDLTDAVPITELDSVLKYAKEAESGSEIIFTEESPIAIDYQNPNYVDWKWYYSFRKAEGNFNPVTLREAIEYTDNIDIGGSYGELKYKCNLYVYQQQKVVNLFSTILSAARAYWFYDEKGRYEIHNDKPLKNPVLLITDENCLSSSNTRSFTKQIAGYHITFKDENNSFQNGEIYVLREGQTLENHTRDIKDLSFSGITNAKQAWALGAYLLGQSITQREIWTRKLNHIGNSLTIGSLVNVQSSTLEIGTDNSGRITKLIEDENYIYGFLIDNVYSYRAEYNADESNVQGCSIMQPTESTSSRIVTVRFANKNQQTKGISVVQNDETIIYSNCYGKTNLVLLEKRIIKANHKQENQKDDEDTETSSLSNFIPKLGDIVAFGNVGRITSKAVVFNLTYDENNCVTVQLYPYFDSLYSAGKKLPIYESNITRKSITDNIPIKNAETYSIVNNSIEKSNSNIQSQISKIEDSINNIVLDADTTPPTIPILQSCISDNLGDISITFLQSTDEESGVHHYVLYKKQDGGMLEQSLIIEYDEQATSGYIIKDYPSVKNKNYTYYVSAVDNNGNESAFSNGINVKSEVTEKPYIPTNFIATAFENYIKLHWDFEKSTNSVYNPNRFKLEVKRNSTSNWEEIAESSINEFSYYFDRTKDGYPEIDDLSAYQFRVKSISVYDVESDYCLLTKIKTDNYLGWEIGTIDVSSYAVEGLLYVKINYTNSSYGEKYFTINYGDNVIAENVSSGRLFAFKLIGYQEVSDITNKDIIVSCKSVANNSSVTLKGSNIDISLYKTYKITKPTVSAYADRTGVHINWTDNSGDYYLIPTYTLQINSKDVLSAKNVLSYDNLFADNIYPTKNDIAKISIKLKVETEADSVEVSNITIDVSNFLGWIPNVPDIRISVSGRTVPLSWNIQNDNVYDFLGCEIQVAKAYKIVNDTYIVITDKTELEWYAPALGLNPYENLDNYKKGDKDSYLSVKGSSVAFSVPLYGQDNDGTISTMYAYRARAYTKGGKSAWTDTYFVEVKPVSAYDVVKAWDLNDNGEKVKLDGALGVKQIFVEELAAISANLGYITDGALQGDQYNYWAVNDIKLEDGTVLCKGAFRVGGKEQYIEVKPIIENGVATGEYNINFVVNDVSISSDGTRIDGQSFTVYDKDGQLMFKTSPEGNFILVDEGTFTYTKPLVNTLYTDIPNPALADVTNYRIVNNLNYNDKIYTAILFLSPSYDDYGNSFLSLYSEDDKIQIWSSKDWQKDNSPYNILKSSDNKLVALRVDCTSNNTVSFKKSVYDFESNKLNDSLLYSYNTSNTPTDDLFLVLDALTKEDTMPMVLDDWLINVTCTKDSATFDNTTTFYALNLKTNSYFIKSFTNRNFFFDNVYSYITKDDKYFYVLTFARLATLCIRINIENQEIGIIGLPFVSYQGTRENFFNVKENSFVRCVNNKLYVFLITPSFYKTTQSAETLTTDAIGIIDLSAVNWATSSSNIQLSKGILYTCNSARYYPISVFSKNTDIYLIDRYLSGDGTSDTTATLAPFFTNFFFCSLKDDKKISYELTEIAGTVIVEKSKKLKNINYDSGPVFTYDFLVSTPRCFVDSNNEVTMQGLQISITDDGCITDYLANGFTSDLGAEYALYFLSLEKSFAKITNIKFYKELSHEITKKEVYGTGIGFTQILYDNKNNVVRYGLDNGFHLDFDKEGNLLSTQGEQGIRGEKGDKGDKGDTGAIGAQGYSIVSSVSRNEQTDDWWSIYGTIGHTEAWNNTENSRNGCRIGDIFTVVGTSTSGKAHIAFYKSTTASGKLTGTCIAYSYAEKGEKGDKGDKGTTGNGISSITYYYATSTSQTQPSTITSTSIPTLSTTNKYLWQKQVITYTDGTNKTNIALICVYGDKGNTGEKGTSITKVEQTETSSVSGGKNKLTVTLSDGTKSEFVVTNGKLIFPAGFVYTQYSGTASPATLGLEVATNCAWVDITSKYTGAFFRAFYSSSGAFSDTSISQQSSQLSSHTHTINHEHTVSTSVSNAHHVYFTGSKGHPSANANVNTDYQLGGNSNTSVSVSVGSYSGSSGSTGSSELRPRNVAIKIWQVQEV